MAHRIRKLFNDNIDPLENVVEIDETYHGAKEINKHKDKRIKGSQGRSSKSKAPVIGAVERKGNIIAKVVTDTTSATIEPFVKEYVNPKAQVKTDEYKSYNQLRRLGYKHDIVCHSAKEYVRGNTHTNNLENFWSQLKRSINGTYHSVSRKHLQSYVNEFAYRYNRRNQESPILFDILERSAQPL